MMPSPWVYSRQEHKQNNLVAKTFVKLINPDLKTKRDNCYSIIIIIYLRSESSPLTK